jgi:hypothetical protein
MKLDGSTSPKDKMETNKKELHLLKTNAAPLFPDEWDFLIDNYSYGVAHPEIVDSIEQYAFNPGPAPVQAESGTPILPHNSTVINSSPVVPREETTISPVANESPLAPPSLLPPSAQTNEERFTSRTKILQNVIPVKGDSIELRFYDNAEIDGDSIAVFLNGRLLKEHILLAETAYTMKIALTDLQSDNELVMVAENLGSIPPNTSLMVAIVEDKRYEAHLQSTEGSSALVRLVKP